MAGIIRGDLQEFRCDDGFIAQQCLTVKPRGGLGISPTLLHPSMKTLMTTLELTLSYPPVINTKIAFAGEVMARYQRLEWPKLLRSYGHIIMANGQKIRIQTAKLVNSPAARARQREQARKTLVEEAEQVNIHIDEMDKNLSWAVLDELAKEVYQADIRPAMEFTSEDVVVVDDDAIIEVDSGLGSRQPTPVSPEREVAIRPPVPPMVRHAPPMVPVPSARPPTPSNDLQMTKEAHTELLEQVKAQRSMVIEFKELFQDTHASMRAIKADIKALQDQVK